MTPRNQAIHDQLHAFEFMGRHIVTEEVQSSFFLHELDIQFGEEYVKESIDFLRAVNRVNTGERLPDEEKQLNAILQKYLETAQIQPKGLAGLYKKFKAVLPWKKEESPSATVNIPSHETSHLVERFIQHTLSLEDFEDANNSLISMLQRDLFPRLNRGAPARNLTRALELDQLIEQDSRMRNIREALVIHSRIPHAKHFITKGPLEDSHKQVKKMQKMLANIANETLALLDEKHGKIDEREAYAQDRLQIMNDFRDKNFEKKLIALCDKYAQKQWIIITTKHHLPKKASKTLDHDDVSTLLSVDAESSSTGFGEIPVEADIQTPSALPRKTSSSKELIKAGHSRTELNVILDLYVTLKGHGTLDAAAKAQEIFNLSMQLGMEEEKIEHRGRSRNRTPSKSHRTPSPSPSPARLHTPVSSGSEYSSSYLPLSSSLDSAGSALRLSSASDRSDSSLRPRSVSRARRNALISDASALNIVEHEEDNPINDSSIPPMHPTASGSLGQQASSVSSSSVSYSSHSLFHSQNRTTTAQVDFGSCPLSAALPPRSVSAPKRDIKTDEQKSSGRQQHRGHRVNLFASTSKASSTPVEENVPPRSSTLNDIVLTQTDVRSTTTPSKSRPS
ncbi:MAG: hypothetical protein ABI597_05325 [Gammaproteobacteria bacterium]